MRTTANLLIDLLLRRHPRSEMLQACADLELTGLPNRLIRLHATRCEECRNHLKSIDEILDLFRPGDTDPKEIAVVRENIVTAIACCSGGHQVAIGDMHRVLGSRAANGLVNGEATPQLRDELAAFLGTRAANSLLRRMAV